jgi:hypothetical protein
MPPAQLHDATHHRRRRAAGAVVWPAGSISHPGRAHRRIANRPAFGRRPGHVKVFGGPNNGPAVVDNTAREQQAAPDLPRSKEAPPG